MKSANRALAAFSARTTLAALLLPLTSLQAQTGLTVETWNGLSRSDSIIVLQQEGISNRAPDATSTTTAGAEVSGATALKDGQRLRGTITPTLTDNYTFWISGKDNVALWISDDASRFNKKLVAYNLGTTTLQNWDSHPSQKSVPIQLTGGQSYYLEAQVMDKNGGGHVSIGWRGQSGRYALDLNASVATQSSTKWGKEASAAIDGDAGGVWGRNATTLTNNEPNSWWQVDFGQDREINQVVLHNMSNNQKRLSNFRISVLDAKDVELIGQDFFTTSGNVGDSMTWDLPASQPTARKVKIQYLGYNLTGKGELALAEVEVYGAGLVAGQVNHREVIPQAVLSPIAADPDDVNDNNISDAFETSTGLSTSAHPEALLEYGDPDKDGISNFQEQFYGSDPLSKEALADGLTRYIWMGINGSLMTHLTKNKAFHGLPNAIDHVPGVDSLLGLKLYGSRYRGTIVAPATGEYRFWVSGSGGGAELWLADGTITEPGTTNTLTNRFGKRLLCSSGHVTPLHDFDYEPRQKSESIFLTQGQRYYVEALHATQNGKVDHISVAWTYPGQDRQIIPALHFLSDVPDETDADSDNLPDAWESTVGLDPAENGFSDLDESEYGDPDADGLTNLQEYQFGTNPHNGDSDGDGYSDSQEIHYYGSDPLSSNNLAPVVVNFPNLEQYSTVTGGWVVDSNGQLTANERRSAISYSFTVTEPGIHEVTVEATALWYSWHTKQLNLELTLNRASSPFAKGQVSSNSNNTGTMSAVTPWLEAGTHTLTIFHNNYDARLRMKLVDVDIQRLGGADLDSDGIPDWIKAKAAATNLLTKVPTHSRTSPLSLQGVTEQFSSVTMSSTRPGASQAHPVALTPSINDSFFTDISLDETGAVTLDTSFMSGLVTQSHQITWMATNLFETFADDTLHIRQGDSLRLDAWSGATADGLPFTVTLDGTLLEDAAHNTTHTAGQPFASTFGTAGSFTLVATHNGQSATVTLEVHAADFGPDHTVRVDVARSWQPTSLGLDHIVQADERIVFTETTANPSAGPRTFIIKADEPINRSVIARLPDNVDGAPSAILAKGTVHPFEFALVNQTNDAEIVHQYHDGTWLMRNSIVAANLPANAFIRIEAKNQGLLFTNGTRWLELSAGDFDQNGIAYVYYEKDGSQTPKICHKVRFFIEL